MQKEQKHLLSQIKCSQSCQLDPSSKSHTGNHESLSQPVLTLLLQQCTIPDKFTILNTFQKSLTTSLQKLRNKIDILLHTLTQQLERSRCELALGLKQKQTIDACVELVRGEGGNLGKVRCCDVYQLNAKIGEFGFVEVEVGKMEDKVRRIVGGILDELRGEIGGIQILAGTGSGKNEKVQGAKKVQVKPIVQPQSLPKVETKVQAKKPKQPQKNVKVQQKYEYQSDQQAQLRPGREPADPKPRQPQPQSTSIPPPTPISSLAKKSTHDTFSVRIKITRIVKHFKIQSSNKIQFRAGDESGTATCVMNENALIVEGNTIEVSNCRIYSFKGKVKQIQSNKDSKMRAVTGEGIRKIGREFQLSEKQRGKWANEEKEEKRQERKDRGPPPNTNRDRDTRPTTAKNNDTKVQTISIPSPRIPHNDSSYQQYSGPQSQSQQLQQPSFYPKLKSPSPSTNLPGHTKIHLIQPEDSNLNIICQVYKILHCEQQILTCYLGDETGIVRAQLPSRFGFIREDATIRLENVDAPVVEEHILLRMGKGGRVEQAMVAFPIVKISNDVSEEAWVEEN